MDDDAMQAVAWAQALGAHALPAFFLGLGVLLTFVTAMWVVWRRHETRPFAVAVKVPSVPWLSLRLVVGLVVLLLAGALFAEMLEWSDHDDAMGAFDSALALALSRSVQPSTLQVFGWLTRLGDPPG